MDSDLLENWLSAKTRKGLVFLDRSYIMIFPLAIPLRFRVNEKLVNFRLELTIPFFTRTHVFDFSDLLTNSFVLNAYMASSTMFVLSLVIDLVGYY